MKKSELVNVLVNHRTKLTDYAYMLTSNSFDADDLYQDTVLKVLQKHHLYEEMEEGSLIGWLMRIMKNTFINSYRRKRSRKEFSYANIHVFENCFSESPQINDCNKDTYAKEKKLVGLISKLKDDKKVPLEMYNKGFDYKEIAQVLELPMGTVKNKIFLARKSLKEMIRNMSNGGGLAVA